MAPCRPYQHHSVRRRNGWACLVIRRGGAPRRAKCHHIELRQPGIKPGTNAAEFSQTPLSGLWQADEHGRRAYIWMLPSKRMIRFSSPPAKAILSPVSAQPIMKTATVEYE